MLLNAQQISGKIERDVIDHGTRAGKNSCRARPKRTTSRSAGSRATKDEAEHAKAEAERANEAKDVFPSDSLPRATNTLDFDLRLVAASQREAQSPRKSSFVAWIRSTEAPALKVS